jgi:hypothetical protein
MVIISLTEGGVKDAYKAGWFRRDLADLMEREEPDEILRVRFNEYVEFSFLRKRMLREMFPDIFFQRYRADDKKIVLEDTKKGLVTITIKDGCFFCEKDNNAECEHVKYVRIHPDGPVLWKVHEVVKL